MILRQAVCVLVSVKNLAEMPQDDLLKDWHESISERDKLIPMRSFWLRPGRTVRYLVDEGNRLFFWVPAAALALLLTVAGLVLVTVQVHGPGIRYEMLILFVFIFMALVAMFVAPSVAWVLSRVFLTPADWSYLVAGSNLCFLPALLTPIYLIYLLGFWLITGSAEGMSSFAPQVFAIIFLCSLAIYLIYFHIIFIFFIRNIWIKILIYILGFLITVSIWIIFIFIISIIINY